MNRGFNLVIAFGLDRRTASPPTRSAPQAQDPFVHRFELDIQCETAEQAWHATLTTRGGRGQLEFDTPMALMRALAQLTLRPRFGSDGAALV